MLFRRGIFGFDVCQSNRVCEGLGVDCSHSFLLVSYCPVYAGCAVRKVFIPRSSVRGEVSRIITNFSRHAVNIRVHQASGIMSVRSSPLRGFADVVSTRVGGGSGAEFCMTDSSSRIGRYLGAGCPSHVVALVSSLSHGSLRKVGFTMLSLFYLDGAGGVLKDMNSSCSRVTTRVKNVRMGCTG